jgi:hypothetical protein
MRATDVQGLDELFAPRDPDGYCDENAETGVVVARLNPIYSVVSSEGDPYDGHPHLLMDNTMLCWKMEGSIPVPGLFYMITSDKSKVTCPECLEIIHS